MAGAIGPLASLEKKNAHVSEQALGEGGTTAWKLCSLDAHTSAAIYIDVSASFKPPSPLQPFLDSHLLYFSSSLLLRAVCIHSLFLALEHCNRWRRRSGRD